MIFTTLIPTTELALHLDDPDWVILDCRFTLADPARGRGDYLQAHIPGAIYAHLDEDLSGRVVHGRTGRHPLPSVEMAAHAFSNWGIAPGVQVVVYDDAGGALAAGQRLVDATLVGSRGRGSARWGMGGMEPRGGGTAKRSREAQPSPVYPLTSVLRWSSARLRSNPCA